MIMITDLAGDVCLPVTAIALGTFDGVHAGHRSIIRRAAELAGQAAGKSLVFTSCGHPLAQLDPERCPPMIADRRRKIKLIREQGTDYLCMIPFTRDFLQLSPEEFLDLLHRKFAPRHIVVGPNYTFGHKGAGTVETLRRLADRYGLSVVVPEAVNLDGVMVSSTVIRRLIAEGAVNQAARLLMRPVGLRGHVDPVYDNNRFTPNSDKGLIPVSIQPGLAVPADGLYHVALTAERIRCSGLARIASLPPAPGRRRFVLKFHGGQKPTQALSGRAVELEFAAACAAHHAALI